MAAPSRAGPPSVGLAAGLAAGLVAALCAAGAPALAESQRDDTAPSQEKADSDDDGGGFGSLFKDLDLGFGGDDDDGGEAEDGAGDGAEEAGTYLGRFEAPAPHVYRELAAQRPINLAIERSRGLGLVSAPALNAYVNDVLLRLVAASPVPGLDARALVRAESRFSAYSTPDGSIYVSIGLLQTVVSEDELAAVLAHELAHVLYRHHGTDWFANSQKIAAQGLSLAQQAKAALEGKETGEESQSVLLTSVAGELSERVVAPNLWNREQEREADSLGLDLLIAAGYPSSAAVTSLERLAFYEADSRERARQELEEAAKAAEADMNESIESGDLSQIVVGLVKGAGTALGVASEAAIDAIGGGDHDPAEVRIERLGAYINREYLLAPRPAPSALPWQSPAHPTAPILANYRTANQAEGALAAGELDKAEGLIRTAVGAPTKADAYPRLVFSRLREQQGDFAKAYRNLEIATGGSEPAFAIYRLMIEKQLAGGRAEEAARLVGEAARRLDEPPTLYPYQIAVLVDARKKAEALAVFGKCKVTYPDLAPACNRALGGLRGMTAEAGQSDSPATNKLLDREVTDPASKAATGFAQ